MTLVIVLRVSRLRSLYLFWLPVVLGVAAIVNVILTVTLLPEGVWPVRSHASGSLTELVHTEQVAVNLRFGFYMELDDATDGGRLFVPVGSFVSAELAEGFADFEVTELDYDPASPIPDRLDDGRPVGLVSTEEGDIAYWIAPGDADTWWITRTREGFVVLPESTLPVPDSRP